MRIIFILLLTLATVVGFAQPCQWDRFKQATGDSPEGQAFTDAIDADVSLIDDWEKLDNADIRNVERQLSTLEPEQIGPYLKDISNNIPLARKFEGGEISVDSWKILNETGETGLVSRVDDIEFVDGYIKNSEKTPLQVTSEITDAGGYNAWKVANEGNRFIAKTGIELRKYLDDLVDIPIGETHKGNLYRSLTKTSQKEYGALAEKMTDHTVYSSWGRYDLDNAENAMYLSKTIDGNKTEVTHYLSDWKEWNTYEFKGIEVNNLLDLTDDAVRSKLGTQFDDLVRTYSEANERLTKARNYDLTNTLASWARDRGYNGIIAPGARGSQNYENIILFEQSYIDQALNGASIEKLIK